MSAANETLTPEELHRHRVASRWYIQFRDQPNDISEQELQDFARRVLASRDNVTAFLLAGGTLRRWIP